MLLLNYFHKLKVDKKMKIHTFNYSKLAIIFTLVLGMIASLTQAIAATPGSHVKIYIPSLPYLYISHAINGSLIKPADNHQGWDYDVAVSHSQINDTTYEFKLRQGVVFQDGSPFNADSVIENMTYFKKQPFLFSKINLVYDYTEKVDDYTVRFHLKEKYGSFLNDVIWMQFYTTTYLEKFGWNGKATSPNLAEAGPYGLGPYILQEGYIEGDRQTEKAVLVANPNYYNKEAAKVETFTIYTQLDSKVALSDVSDTEGALDIMPIPITEAEKVQNSAYAKLVNSDSNSNIAVHINMITGNPKLKDKKVRLALNRALDQKKMGKTAFKGFAEIKPTMASPNYPGVRNAMEKIQVYSEAEAPKAIRSELKSVLNGLTLNVLTQERYMFMWKAIARDFRKVGVKLNFDITTDEKVIFEQLLSTNAGKNTKQWDLLVWGNDDWYFNHPWSAFFVYQTDSVWSTVSPDTTMNNYISEMFKESTGTPEFDKSVYNIMQHVYDNAYMLVVPAPKNVYAVNNKLTNFKPYRIATMPLWDISVTDSHWSLR